MTEHGQENKVTPAVFVEPERWVPVIDSRHCKGCGECVESCDHNVLEIRLVDPTDYETSGWFARMSIRRHGMQIAYASRTDNCQSCSQCLEARREHAIRRSQPISDQA